MISYEEAMAAGAREYRDVTSQLAARGLPATFTQTGGMNAAIEISLDGGAYVLITEVEDALPWYRDDHRGWGVGLYADAESQDQLAFETSQDPSIAALVALVHSVLRSGIGT